MKRFGVRRSAWYGGALAIVTFVALTLFVVLPALASDVGVKVPPTSAAGVTPVDVNAGGAQTCNSLFPGMSAQFTSDPSPPQPGTTAFWTPTGANWSFKLTSGALPNFSANKGQSLAVDSQGNAVILGIGIKGGTDNLIYDYRQPNTNLGWVTQDSILHAPASKFTTGTNPESGITQYYGVSQLVICYKTPAATISGNAYKDLSPSPNQPLSGLTVTLTDTTQGEDQGTHTVPTDANGNYQFVAIPGDNYTVCIQAPTAFNNAQTAPLNDGANNACAAVAGAAPKGYSITSLPAGGVSGENFGFQPLSSVGGRVYDDLSNPPDAKYDTGDQGQSGWTVTLYQNTGTQASPVWSQIAQTAPPAPGGTDSNGFYNFANAVTPGGDYLVCESPPASNSTKWGESQPNPAQSQPNPNATTTQCIPPNPLNPNPPTGEYGYRFTATSSNITNLDFGNIAGVPEACPPPQPFGSDETNGQLSIQLAACKPDQTFVFNMAATDDPNAPWVSVFASDQSQREVPLIEKIVFDDPIMNGAPSLQHLAYTDTFPYDPNNTKPMPYCKVDPRVPGDPEGMTLSSSPTDYTDDANKGLVLPNDIGTSTQATSCAISIRTYVDAQGDGHLEAFVYSDIDGLTKGTG